MSDESARPHVRAPGGQALGVTVMPEWFQYEGVEPVLDRIAALGADAIVTSPYVMEPCTDGEGGREPPPDGEAGSVRPLDRDLWGRRVLWVRTAPAFAHDFARYRGLRYQPSPATDLTRRHADLLDRVSEACARRGLALYLQVMAASPPGYRVQFSGAIAEDQCLGPDGRTHPARVDRNASLASPHVVDYVATLLRELAERYPGVTGFRLDWPEYPPYDFASALFDFNPQARAAMREAGHDPAEVARGVMRWAEELRAAARSEPGARAQAGADVKAGAGARAGLGPGAPRQDAPPARILARMREAGWDALFADAGPLAVLFDAKRRAALALLRACRASLDAASGPRRRLEPQAFPPPFHRISGFPLDALDGVADAVGIKLYTMHWPMLARYWARDLLGSGHAARVDAVTAAVAHLFGLTDTLAPDGSTLRYPEPDTPHPVGARAQRGKLEAAQATAGAVPIRAFAHTYGPVDDVVRRAALAAQSSPRLWLNRYGYLSDDKLGALARREP
jgi:hypothetical protein